MSMIEDDQPPIIPPLNKWVPQVITGGKGGPPGSPWLNTQVEIGDIFLARHVKEADKNFELNMFCLLFKTAKSAKLRINLVDKDYITRWVDIATFSREMIFNEVIGREEDLGE